MQVPPEQLLALAPVQLTNRRSRRYRGDDVFCRLDQFTEEDQTTIRELYEFLTDIFAKLKSTPETVSIEPGSILEFMGERDLDSLMSRLRGLGRASYALQPSGPLAKTVHDVRGGGLTSLLATMEMIRLFGEDPAAINSLFFLTRDHLKIMRNALVGLDDERREDDLQPKLHSTRLIVQKWQNALFGTTEHRARVEIDCHFQGDISECCVEFGALDRVLYNLINNACRHTASARVRMVILPLPTSGEAEDLRFVIVNEVGEPEAARLRQMTGGVDDLAQLFAPGVSSTGSGLGLTIAADFVCNAYGIANRAEALEKRYLGARIGEGQFMAWFHWPLTHGI